MSTSRPSSPARASPIETSRLEELRARLIDAQAAELMASRALADFDTVGKSAGASFSNLMADFRAAQHRTTVAYQEWSQAVEAFNQAPSGIVEPHTSPGAREMDQSPDASN